MAGPSPAMTIGGRQSAFRTGPLRTVSARGSRCIAPLIGGLAQANISDQERVERGAQLFDNLYALFRELRRHRRGHTATVPRVLPGRLYFRRDGVMALRSHHFCLYATCRCEEISPPTAKEQSMTIPYWLKPGLWGAAAGAIAISIVGFSQLGWTTSSTSEKLAQERADTAVVAALVPFCVVKAQQDPDTALLAKFQAEQSSYSRSDMVVKAGWATLGNKKSPDDALARACSDKLKGMKSG
jgi:hypothetical protein